MISVTGLGTDRERLCSVKGATCLAVDKSNSAQVLRPIDFRGQPDLPLGEGRRHFRFSSIVEKGRPETTVRNGSGTDFAVADVTQQP